MRVVRRRHPLSISGQGKFYDSVSNCGTSWPQVVRGSISIVNGFILPGKGGCGE